MIGADYTERIAPAALKAAGIAVVFRYLSNPGWPKNLTAAEARELLAAGIPIVLNYETTADFMLGGYGAGQACARSARAQATALGAPPNTKIYYSADFDATAAQTLAVLDFSRGVASIDGAAEEGVYGGLRVVQAEAAAGEATWQTIAWSGGSWDPHAVARQTGEQRTVGGVVVDVNEIINLAALGAWGGPNSPITPSSGGPDVNLTDTVTISQGFTDRYPDVNNPPDGFTTGAKIQVGLLWEGAALRAVHNEHLLSEVRDQITALTNLVSKGTGGTTDVAQLAADLGPLLHPTTDVNALAAALAPHVGAPDPVAFAAALAPHIKVTSA